MILLWLPCPPQRLLVASLSLCGRSRCCSSGPDQRGQYKYCTCDLQGKVRLLLLVSYSFPLLSLHFLFALLLILFLPFLLIWYFLLSFLSWHNLRRKQIYIKKKIQVQQKSKAVDCKIFWGTFLRAYFNSKCISFAHQLFVVDFELIPLIVEVFPYILRPICSMATYL